MWGYDIRLFSTDERLRDICEKILPDGGIASTFSVASEFSPDAAAKADIVICDEALTDARALRRACRENALIIFCVTPGAPATDDAAYICANEVWPKPLVHSYAEKRLRRLLQSLREKQECHLQRLYLDTVIDTSPDLIWFKDTRGAHLKVNEAFCQAVGKTKAQIKGRGHYYIWDIPPEEYAEGEYVCLETEEIVLARRERCLFDEKVKCKQGLRRFKTYKAPLIDDDGSLLGTLGVAQDMTTQVLTASQLSQSMANFATATNVAHLHYWKFNPVPRTTNLTDKVHRRPEILNKISISGLSLVRDRTGRCVDILYFWRYF